MASAIPCRRHQLGRGQASATRTTYEEEIIIGFRPEAAQLNEQGQLSGEVYASELQGAYTMLHANINEHEIVHIRSDRQAQHPIGTLVKFNINPQLVRFFDPVTEKTIHREVDDE
jgi:ABC-type sugar transport system ATPase subunit